MLYPVELRAPAEGSVSAEPSARGVSPAWPLRNSWLVFPSLEILPLCPVVGAGRVLSRPACELQAMCYMPSLWEERRGSNPQPLGPQPSALANCATLPISCCTPGRIRTSGPRLRRPLLCPLSYGRRLIGSARRAANQLGSFAGLRSRNSRLPSPSRSSASWEAAELLTSSTRLGVSPGSRGRNS